LPDFFLWVKLNRLAYDYNPHQLVDQQFNRDSKSSNTNFQTLENLSNEYSIVRACIQEGQNKLH